MACSMIDGPCSRSIANATPSRQTLLVERGNGSVTGAPGVGTVPRWHRRLHWDRVPKHAREARNYAVRECPAHVRLDRHERVVLDAGLRWLRRLPGGSGLRVWWPVCASAPGPAGASNAGRKVMALIFARVLGADYIDDCEVVRTGRPVGGWVAAPSTLGALTYLISVRVQFWVPDAIAKTPDCEWQPLKDYPQQGEAHIAETTAGGRRLIVRRARVVGPQAELSPTGTTSPLITNRTEPLKVIEADHRQHAVRRAHHPRPQDQALARFPSGKLDANSAWTVIAASRTTCCAGTPLIGMPRPVGRRCSVHWRVRVSRPGIASSRRRSVRQRGPSGR